MTKTLFKLIINIIIFIFIYSNILLALDTQGTDNKLRCPLATGLNGGGTKRALHIGCGASLQISEDVDQGFEVLVVDIGPEAIDMQKVFDEGYRESQNPLPRYLNMDASDIKPDSKDFPSNGFDKIVIRNVFEVFAGLGEEKVITAILELIKEGGEVYATTRNDTEYSPETEVEMLLRIAKSKGMIIDKVSDDMKPNKFMGGTFAIFKVISKNSIDNTIPTNISKSYVNI